ncbi:hypothetical protein ABZ883_06915 [Streptomyces sp. NPDC046977]|uniref:hypothetical protein n=1 Tax=Streptomyces sp. NPDC046977 TaxID=3154703 RepID=UPI0034094237
MALIPPFLEARDNHEDRKEEKAIEDGPAVKVTRGESPMLAYDFAFEKPTYSVSSIADESGWGDGFTSWLGRNRARPVGIYAVRITVKALRDDTTIIQDFRLSDRHCDNEVANTVEDIERNMHGTLVYPPALGGPGEDVKRDVLGFQVSQYDETRARVMAKGFPRLGSVSKGTETQMFLRHRFSARAVVLEQNDARTFDIYFGSALDCTFGLEMNITSGDEDDWVKIPINVTWWKGEGAAIAGPDEPYDTLVRPKVDGSGMELGNAMREGGVPGVSFMVDDVSP